ncbi:uncharacterized protein LOC126323765 [Schistocerca gregaria]|uniref:uncharacterized protein LOC126323765 n=1 Tax=Schistocerca gregaria TaxID=7010 RepID=UPI00211EC7F5|nr:uncharacterized protein LOC126323765 [Schistocerca gregaria]
MSKIRPSTIDDAIKKILDYSLNPKTKRNFVETIELQIGLKNIDPSRDKRFAGSYRLPYVARPKTKVCVIGDQKHLDICKELGVNAVSVDDLKKFNKNKKLIKKWARSYDVLLATDTLIRQIPRLVGPQLNKMGMFPSPIAHTTNILEKITEIKSTIKFQLKKVLCLGVAIGHVNMSKTEIKTHVNLSINFLISLLKKGWQNIRSIYVKSTMGPPVRIC